MSCLFDSMYKLLGEYGIYFQNSQVLRERIANFMKENPSYSLETGTVSQWVDMVAKDMNNDSSGYVRTMEQPSTWGGGMEMAVMSKIFSITIIVIGRGKTEDNPNAIFDCTGGSSEAQFILHWTGSHYTPVKIKLLNKSNNK